MDQQHYGEYYFTDSAEVSNVEYKEENRIVQEINRMEGEEEIRFGDQLQDDLINSFCDKLQAVCPQKLEALLAIQFLMITDKEDVRRHVSGKHSAIQVLYDRTRAHYIMVHYNPLYNHVELYDSLQPYENGMPMMITDTAKLISHLFGHLHQKYIPILIDREFEAQSDNFSCGYRVVAALVDLARGRNPACYTYSRSAILAFMRNVLSEPRPTWQMFESANFGTLKGYSGNYRIRCVIENTTFVPSAPSSSRSSSSADSISTTYRMSCSQIPFERTDERGTVSPQKVGEDFIEKSFDYIEQYFSTDKYINWVENIVDKCDNVFNQFFRVKSEDFQEDEMRRC